ncbi:MAG: hypothetical protein ABI910_11035, partial [Gemmatimonadota bacterium]
MSTTPTGRVSLASAPPPDAARRPASDAARGLVWLHLFIAWLPVWVLYSTLIATAHGAAMGQ